MDLIKETGAGLTTANSYADVDDGDLYHEGRLFVIDWTSASDDDKEAALIWATKLIDKLVAWNGIVVTKTQALAWPRQSVLNAEGYYLSQTIVPQDLIDATCEFARYLITSDRSASSASGLKSFKAGSLAIEFDKYDRESIMPKSVWILIRQYGSKSGSTGNRMLERM